MKSLIHGSPLLFPKADKFVDHTPLPPVIPDLRFVCLLREVSAETVILIFPNGDNYEIKPPVLDRWLAQYKIEEDIRGKIASYVWNFYSIALDLQTAHCESVPLRDLVNEITERIQFPDCLR